MATINTLVPYLQARLEETSDTGTWWSVAYELRTALAEAENDLMLLIGRPTQVFNLPFTLTANTCFQTVPKGVWAITDIQGSNALYKVNLFDLDYTQSSWGSDWQQDVDVACARWAPLGFNMFAVHPAPSAPVNVNITAIQYPVKSAWPYDGTQTVPFEDNYFELLEEYAAFYCRIKEMGNEFQEGMKLFQQYMQGARRMTQIQDRRDPLLFSGAFGAVENVNPISKR